MQCDARDSSVGQFQNQAKSVIWSAVSSVPWRTNTCFKAKQFIDQLDVLAAPALFEKAVFMSLAWIGIGMQGMSTIIFRLLLQVFCILYVLTVFIFYYSNDTIWCISFL